MSWSHVSVDSDDGVLRGNFRGVVVVQSRRVRLREGKNDSTGGEEADDDMFVTRHDMETSNFYRRKRRAKLKKTPSHC